MKASDSHVAELRELKQKRVALMHEYSAAVARFNLRLAEIAGAMELAEGESIDLATGEVVRR